MSFHVSLWQDGTWTRLLWMEMTILGTVREGPTLDIDLWYFCLDDFRFNDFLLSTNQTYDPQVTWKGVWSQKVLRMPHLSKCNTKKGEDFFGWKTRTKGSNCKRWWKHLWVVFFPDFWILLWFVGWVKQNVLYQFEDEVNTLPETNMAHENRVSKKNIVSQAPFFRGELLVLWRVTDLNLASFEDSHLGKQS